MVAITPIAGVTITDVIVSNTMAGVMMMSVMVSIIMVGVVITTVVVCITMARISGVSVILEVVDLAIEIAIFCPQSIILFLQTSVFFDCSTMTIVPMIERTFSFLSITHGSDTQEVVPLITFGYCGIEESNQPHYEAQLLPSPSPMHPSFCCHAQNCCLRT
jgi:hypothetical protein